jgi:hypothetical protein
MEPPLESGFLVEMWSSGRGRAGFERGKAPGPTYPTKLKNYPGWALALRRATSCIVSSDEYCHTYNPIQIKHYTV